MSDAPPHSPLQRWLREPLVHFLVAGLVLFTVYRALNPVTAAQQNSHRIELTEDDLRQLDVGWMVQCDASFVQGGRSTVWIDN